MQTNRNNYLLKTFLFVFILPVIVSNAQGLQLNIHYSGQDSTLEIPSRFPNSKSILDFLNESKIKAYAEGKLAYSIDSLVKTDTLTYSAYVQTGNTYHWGTIKWGVKTQLLQKSGVSLRTVNQSVANPIELFDVYERLVAYYENNGYPFVTVNLDSVRFSRDSISGRLKIAPEELFSYDTIALHGDLKITKSYLAQYLGVIAGKPYQEKTFAGIPKLLKELPFAKVFKAPEVEFRNKKAIIHLYLNKKSANFFNGIVGVLPNSPQLERLNEGSNLLITGDVKLVLINSIRNGEKLNLSWNRLTPLTQRLKLGVSFPYLFKSSFGIDDQFDLLKQDTSFLNISNELGMLYSISSEKTIKVFWEHKSTSLLSAQELQQGEFLGNKSNSYGVSFTVEDLDYKYNPIKGFKINVKAQGGTRVLNGNDVEGKISIDLPNDQEQVMVTALLPKTSTLYRLELNADFYLPLFKVTTLKLSTKSAYIKNPYLFNNDLDRIGGFSLLRGFDEQSIFTSLYSVLTAEYRLILEQNSFFALFFDQAYTQKNTFLNHEDDFPFGIGASISFQTKPGIFTIMYAVGKQLDNPISFTSAKIHFGFVSLF